MCVMNSPAELNPFSLDDSLVALLSRLCKICELEMEQSQIRELLLEERVQAIDLDKFYDLEPLLGFTRALRSIANGKNLPWMVILQNLHTRLGKHQDFLGMEQEIEIPNQIRLIKVLDWLEENPDELDPTGLCVTTILKFCELKAFHQSDALHCYLFLQALLMNKGLPPFLLHDKNDLEEFSNKVFLDHEEPELRVANLFSFMEERFFKKLESDNQENNLYSQARKTLFYKDNPLALANDPEFQALKTLYQELTSEVRDTLVRYTTELGRIDEDLQYRKSQSHPEIKDLKSRYPGQWQTLTREQGANPDLKSSYLFEIQMSAPPGTIWRSQIPDNRFLAGIYLVPNGIQQIYTMRCQSQFDKDRILKENQQDSQLLYDQSTEGQDASRTQEWVQLARIRSQDCFLEYLGQIEQEILKAKQKRESGNA